MSDMLTGQDALIARLEDENARLRRELALKDQQIEQVQTSTAAGVKNLRRQLTPLFTALQQVFGEIDAMGLDDSASVPSASQPADARVAAVWAAWKQKLNAPCGRIIDALLVHGEMNTTQLSVAAQMHKSNVSKAIQKLHEVSVINKNGGRFSLKAL